MLTTDHRRILGVEGRHTDNCALRAPGDEHDCDCGLIDALTMPNDDMARWWLEGWRPKVGSV